MADQDREAAVEAQQDDELDLTLRLRPAPSRRSLHLPNPAAAPVRDDPSDLSMTVPILGEGGTRSEQEPHRLGFPDLQAKRVAQALRRREARKKRDEKRKSKVDSLNERMLWFENRRAEGRESEGGFSELRRKGGNCNGNGANAVTTSFLVRPVGGLGLFGSDGNGFQPVVGAGRACEFRAHCGGGISDNLKRSVSSCSRGSSSGASDYQSTSGQGGSSSDAGSHSSNSHPLDHTIKYCPPPSNDTQLQTSDHNSQPYVPQLNNKADCGSSSYQIKPNQPNPSCYIDQNPDVQTQTSPGKKPMPTDRIQSPSQFANKPKLDPSKPPKPKAHHTNETILLPKMPRVAATGNGPDGKRITGFLYKYTKTEVSIVCVCHGTSFSPAGFVEHAGGVGIQNPLRHITISTSAFNP